MICPKQCKNCEVFKVEPSWRSNKVFLKVFCSEGFIKLGLDCSEKNQNIKILEERLYGTKKSLSRGIQVR
jgi:hypothetical protein